MRRPSKAALRFVRALLPDAVARREGEAFNVSCDGRSVLLPGDEVRALASEGVLELEAGTCRANDGTAQWLKRQMLDGDAFAAQHRIEGRGADGTVLNLAESPLARLALATGEGEAFLAPHQVEAGERRRLEVGGPVTPRPPPPRPPRRRRLRRRIG